MAVTILGIVVLPDISYQLEQRKAVELLRPKEFTIISFDYELEDVPSYDKTDWEKYYPPVRSRVASFVRRVFRTDIFCPVIRLYLADDSESSIELIADLRHLKWLQIGNPSGPLKGRPIPSIAPIGNCTQLEYLAIGNFMGLSSSDKIAAEFKGTGTILLPYDITESDLAVIGKLNKLRILAIGGVHVTDDSIKNLSQLNDLEYLYLSHTSVSSEGVEWLRQEIETVTIVELTDRDRDYGAEIQSRN